LGEGLRPGAIYRDEGVLGYRPTHRVQEGLREAMDWYVTDILGPAG